MAFEQQHCIHCMTLVASATSLSKKQQKLRKTSRSQGWSRMATFKESIKTVSIDKTMADEYPFLISLSLRDMETIFHGRHVANLHDIVKQITLYGQREKMTRFCNQRYRNHAFHLDSITIRIPYRSL
jgi:hypothetical protein